jgi:DNA primase
MPDDFTQLVKQQADIVRIVGEYLKLRKTGRAELHRAVPVS